MLLSNFLYNIGKYFANNKYHGLILCYIITFIFGIGIINIKMDVIYFQFVTKVTKKCYLSYTVKQQFSLVVEQ